MKTILAMIICISLLTGAAWAAPVLWSVADGGNGHWYDAVSSDMDWEAAVGVAGSLHYLGLQGHLATVTSQEENDWILDSLGNVTGYFLGGTDLGPNEGTWTWITGEIWDYEYWNSGEPNNVAWLLPSGEDALLFASNGMWNDVPLTGYSEEGYIIEYEAAPVPEPTTMLLLCTGLFGLYGAKRKLRK